MKGFVPRRLKQEDGELGYRRPFLLREIEGVKLKVDERCIRITSFGGRGRQVPLNELYTNSPEHSMSSSISPLSQKVLLGVKNNQGRYRSYLPVWLDSVWAKHWRASAQMKLLKLYLCRTYAHCTVTRDRWRTCRPCGPMLNFGVFWWWGKTHSADLKSRRPRVFSAPRRKTRER